VDSRTDTSCGAKAGTLTIGVTSMNGNASDIYGADGNDTRNQYYDAGNGNVPATPADIVENVSSSAFDKFIWTDADINALRPYARATATSLQGWVTSNAWNLTPTGVVFVDTVSGNNIPGGGAPPAPATSDFATVSIHGNPPADPSGIFKGILFVNGSL